MIPLPSELIASTRMADERRRIRSIDATAWQLGPAARRVSWLSVARRHIGIGVISLGVRIAGGSRQPSRFPAPALAPRG